MGKRIVVVWAFLTAICGPALAGIDCSTEVTSQVGVTRGGYRLYRRANNFVQAISFRNTTGASVQGPINLVLQGLVPGVTLSNGTGLATCASVTGAPYIEVPVGSDNMLLPGETATVELSFANPAMGNITYTAKVFAGLAVVSPVSNVSISPDAFIAGTPTLVQFRAVVPYVGPAPTVTLELVDASGNLLSTEGPMVDTGNLSAGDEIAGDGTFSLRKTYNTAFATRYRFRIRSSSSGISQVFFLDAYAAISDATLNGIKTAQQNAQQIYNTSVATLSVGGATQAALNAIKTDSLVLDAGLNENGLGIWVIYKDGILGGLLLSPGGTLGDAATPARPSVAIHKGAGANGTQPFRRLGTALPMLATAAKLASGNVEVGNKKVLLLSPFFSSLSAFDINPTLKTLYEGQSCPTYEVTYLKDSAVTVETFKTLSQYGVYNHYGHGDTFYNGLLSLYSDQFGWNWLGAQSVILTGQVASTANKATYQTDLKKGRLAILTGGGDYYAILPDFISTYNSSFPNSIIFINACRSTYNASMANAFLSKGAKTYLGYSNYVDATFAAARANDFHTKWVTDPTSLVTTGESFTPGLSDGSTPPAQWQLLGATNVEAPSGDQLQNGGFESGTLGAWTASGDGRVIPQLSLFSPTEGSFMGVISTGLGFTTSSGRISQKACMPADTKTLNFKWNFNSEEFREYCGSIYQDFFRVDIDTASGSQNLLFRKVDDLCASTFKVPFSFDQGDVWSTGWQTASIDISGIVNANKGKSVTIRFSAGDVGDSIFDTAILLDEIKINK